MKGYSKKYSSTLAWRDFAEAVGQLEEEHHLTVGFTITLTGVLPMHLVIVCQSHWQGAPGAEPAERFRSRVTIPGAQLPNMLAKLYWLVWDIWQQAENSQSARR